MEEIYAYAEHTRSNIMLRLSIRIVTVPDTASYIRGRMQMVLTPNDLFSWNNKYSEYKDILLCHIYYNRFIAHLPAMHTDLLCACWYS